MKRAFIITCFLFLILIVLIAFWFVQRYNDFIFFMICIFEVIISFLLFFFFWKYTNLYPLNNISEFFNFHIAKKYIDKNMEILFEYKDGKWFCYSFENNIILDLKGYLFSKAFIVAYITRQIRYKTLNNKRKKLQSLFMILMKISGMENCNMYLLFKKTGKIKKKRIMRNGISVCNIFCGIISLSRYYLDILSSRHNEYRLLTQKVKRYDEKKYHNGSV